MSVVVYTHPLRTIWMKWHRHDDGVAVVTAYGDQPPEAQIPDHDVLILHSDVVHSHHYPDPDRNTERCLAEVAAFLPEINISDTVSDTTIRVIPSSATLYDAAWTTLLAWSTGLQNPQRPAQSTVMTDIEADLVVLRHEGPVLFAGHRGSTWWCGAMHNDVLILDRHQPQEEDGVASISTHLADIRRHVDHLSDLVVFGDRVQPDVLAQFASSTDLQRNRVRRLEPFRHVRSALSPEQEKSVLHRSHLLGCMVAPMMDVCELPNAYTIRP